MPVRLLQPAPVVLVLLVLPMVALWTGTASAAMIPLRSHSRQERARRVDSSNSSDTSAAEATAPPSAITLTGCQSVDFSAPVTIGAQTFELLVDTGSSTLAVAGASCSSGCSGVTPLYNDGAGATGDDTGAAVSSQYGDGSGWTGTVWTNTVQLGDTPPLSNMAFVVQTQTTGGFYGADCNGAEPGVNQGILGMAYEALAVVGSSGLGRSTDSYADKWEQINLGTAPGQGASGPGSLVFAMMMCSSTGALWVDGYDPTYMSSDLVYVPVTSDLYYSIDLDGIQFVSDGTASATMLHASATSNAAFSGGVTIVDSGTTMFTVPQDVYNDMQAFLNVNSQAAAILGSNFLSSGSCPYLSGGMTVQQINAQLPWLRLNLDGNVALVLPPISSYLQLTVYRGHQYICPGIMPSNSATILGWSVMNNFVTVFDRTNVHNPQGSVGFAATAQCDTGTTASILVGNTPVASSNSGSNTGSNTGGAQLSLGQIIAIIAAVAVLSGLIVFCVLLVLRHRHVRKEQAAAASEPPMAVIIVQPQPPPPPPSYYSHQGRQPQLVVYNNGTGSSNDLYLSNPPPMEQQQQQRFVYAQPQYSRGPQYAGGPGFK